MFWSQRWHGAGKVESSESMGACQPPTLGGPGPIGEWAAELRGPSHFACLPCFSLPGALPFTSKEEGLF